VKHITQAVSPDEYDKEVFSDPMVGALSATGDLRTGRQLLADAAEDQRRSVAWMAACQRGRKELNVMATYTNMLFNWLTMKAHLAKDIKGYSGVTNKIIHDISFNLNSFYIHTNPIYLSIILW
jgi:hypothetical protein